MINLSFVLADILKNKQGLEARIEEVGAGKNPFCRHYDQCLTRAARLKDEIENDRFAPPQQEGIQDERIQQNPALSPEILNQQRLKLNIPLQLKINSDQ